MWEHCNRPVVICFQISIFESLKTASSKKSYYKYVLWFAFKLVSLSRWKQRIVEQNRQSLSLWFAFKLVSLSRWKQRELDKVWWIHVVICFQISIFESLKTAIRWRAGCLYQLWFAFKLVSLSRWKQQIFARSYADGRCDLLSN